MPTSDTEQSSMITYNSSTKLGNVILKINEVFALLMLCHIIEMDVLVSPLEIMNNSLVGQLLLHNEYGLKEVNNPLLNVKMIEFRYHCLLIFKISFILINKCISFVDYVSDIIKDSTICAFI